MSATAPGRWLLWLAAGVIVAAGAAGIWVMGSPAQQRALRLDERRTNELAVLQNAVRQYRQSQGHLPLDLATVAAQPGLQLPLHDPADGTAYGYRRLDGDHFELCAGFDTDSAQPGYRGNPPGDWPHPRGRHCFRRSGQDRDATP